MIKSTPRNGSVSPYKPRRGTFTRKKVSKAVKRKKQTKSGLARQWLYFGDMSSLRYSNVMRGVYWYWLSRDVRKSEWLKWDKKCLTCLKEVENWEDGHCGHIIASAGCGEFLRFNRQNLTLQHAACNNDRFTPMAAALNAIHYDERYGQGAWDALYALRSTMAKEPNGSEYAALIRALPSFQEALSLSPEV